MKKVEFGEDLNKKLKNQFISSKILLDKLKLLDESSRKSSQYQDPNYLPFYFYLGKFINPNFVVQMGLNLGLEFCCLIQSCKCIEKFLGFQYKDENYYSNRLAFSNIKSINKKIILDFHYGKLYDDNFLEKSKNIDLTIITEKNDFDYIKNCLDFCWNNMKLDAYLVIDNLYCKQIQEIFYDFCKVNNVEASVFNTRYQTGIVRK